MTRLAEPAKNPSEEPVSGNHEPYINPPKCGECGRERFSDPAAYPMDAYDYSPLQFITMQPLGWYDGTEAGEGHLCPEHITALIERANR